MILLLYKRKIFVWLAIMLLITTLVQHELYSAETLTPQKQRKNVLLIAVDDLKPTLNCYGETQIISPNIDKLADKGTVFTKAYCQWAVCGPSRASLLTGLTPNGSGVTNLKVQLREINPDVVTLPEYFKLNNYITAACGKVFDKRNVDNGHDSLSWSIPFTPWFRYKYPEEYPPFVSSKTYRVTKKTATEIGPEGIGDDGYDDGQICLDALRKLDKLSQNPDQNFFLAVGFKKPHIPFIAPKKYWELYNREDMNLAPFQRMAKNTREAFYSAREPKHYTDIPQLWTFNDIDRGENILDPDNQRRLIHGYYACVSYIDAQIGKLLAKLEEKGLSENTVVLLFGDHGYHLGDHNLWGKHTNFEQSVRAPLIIYNPGSSPGKYYHNPVEFLDIYPTLCELAGLEIPFENLQGKSLAPALEGEDFKSDYAVTNYHSGYSLRTKKYRYTVWMKSKHEDTPTKILWNDQRVKFTELYDYEKDSLETANLIDDPKYKNIRNEMAANMKEWWNSQYEFLNKQ